MPILKLETVSREQRRRRTPPTYVWINTAHVVYWEAFDDFTDVWTSASRHLVTISPDDLAAAIDPENACPDPNRCRYYSEYCARGEAALTHGGFHAAEQEGAAHIRNCTVIERTNKICEICMDHEQRVRA